MIDFLNHYKVLTNYHFKTIIINKYQFISLFLVSCICILFVSLPVKMAIAKILHPQPQGILILGGSHAREQFTAQFAHLYPDIPIWLSSGADDAISRQIFLDKGVSLNRVYFDRRATDTITNFTTLIADFKQQKIKHLCLVTSDYHISRASAIATIVLGSRGIAFSPISVPEKRESESPLKTLRDTVRAIVWVVTGYTGASLKST